MSKSTTDKVIDMLTENPALRTVDLAKELNVSHQRINQICRKHGLNPARYRAGTSHRTWTNGLGGSVKLSSHFVGGASELTASSDLLRRGIPVYRALTFVSAADLIIDAEGQLLRVEVRSAKTNKDGKWTYATPKDKSRYDVLALVNQDGQVQYHPSDLIPEKG